MSAPLDARKPTLTTALRHLKEDEMDTRTDAVIDELIRTYRPVEHEKNCWTFWHAGYDRVPRWCKRNLIGWVRRLGPSWDVRCVDMVDGSPNHASRFIDAEYLPNCFQQGNMTGQYYGTHASDMIRLPLLYLHGGVWMDCATVLFRSFDDSFWPSLESPNSPYEVFMLEFQFRPHPGQTLNGFIGARKHNPFIQRWQQVFYELWKDRTDCIGLRYHSLIRHLGLIDGSQTERMGFGNIEGQVAHLIVDYLAHNWSFERVRLLVDSAGGWDGPAYFRKHFCLLPADLEYWKSQLLVPTAMQTKLMSLPFQPELIDEAGEQDEVPRDGNIRVIEEGDEHDDARLQRAARDWLTNVASTCLAAKFSGGYWWPESGLPMPLAAHWAVPGHEDDDILPGSWAEWFRYASTYFQQTRKVKVYGTYVTGEDDDVAPIPEFLKIETERVLHAGLLEPALESDGWVFNTAV